MRSIRRPSAAVTLNSKGLGQALIFPYYTVNKGQATLLSLVNVSAMGKAVHVYFQEGYNGREVLSFVVFLSPHDVWTGAVTQASDEGGAKITSHDKSCVSPASDGNGNDFASGIAFATSGFDGSAFPADGGPTSVTRTREGFMYVVTNGDLDPQSATARLITHAQNGTPDGGAPTGCSQLSGVLINGSDLQPPTSTLAGSAAIVNVDEGIFFSYNADALSDFTSIALIDSVSTVGFDNLSHANNRATSNTAVTAHVFGASGRPRALDYALGIDAVSAVFAADAIYNDYLVDPQLGAQTDWVVTFPTKQFYTDPQYVGSEAIAPFAEPFGATTPGQSNVAVGMTVHDREEGTAATVSAVSAPALSYQVNIVSFSQTPAASQASPVLGSNLVSAYVPPYGSDGWASMDLASGDGGHQFRPAASGVILSGLPATGFMVYNVINANAQPGMLANYGGTFAYRSTVSCDAAMPCP